MLTEIQTRLSGVHRRQRLMRGISWSVCGLFTGGVAAIGLAILWRVGAALPWWAPLVAFGSCAGLGGLLGLVVPLSWRSTAACVDAHYQLKDRSLTALQFAAEASDDPLRQLQVTDALDKLADIQPAAVVSWQRPRWLLAAMNTGIAVALIMLFPAEQPVAASVPVETRQMLDELVVELDETMLEELRELAEKNDEEKLDQLVKELEELVQELKEPNVDQREALAKLSMMQQTITTTMAEFNLEQVDSALQSLASSVESAEALQPIAADLRKQDYEAAAEKLEELDPQQLSNKEKRTVSGNLKKLSENLSKASQGKLSESTGELAEGLEKNNDSQCQSAACKLAGLCKTQSLRKSICQCLGNQCNQLGLCKSNCNKNGGNSIAKSNSPKNTWGTGKTNKPLGDEATKLDSTREELKVTGEQGEGPSERETMSTTEAKQLATRDYQERYREFRKQAEAVLESEPLPLGHRQTVKQYFENIRPEEPDQE